MGHGSRKMNHFHLPVHKLSMQRSRLAFSVAAPSVWNSSADYLRDLALKPNSSRCQSVDDILICTQSGRMHQDQWRYYDWALYKLTIYLFTIDIVARTSPGVWILIRAAFRNVQPPLAVTTTIHSAAVRLKMYTIDGIKVHNIVQYSRSRFPGEQPTAAKTHKHKHDISFVILKWSHVVGLAYANEEVVCYLNVNSMGQKFWVSTELWAQLLCACSIYCVSKSKI